MEQSNWVDGLVGETVSSGWLKKASQNEIAESDVSDANEGYEKYAQELEALGGQEFKEREIVSMTHDEICNAANDFTTVAQVNPRNVRAGLQRLYPAMTDSDFESVRKIAWAPYFEGMERIAADKAETVFYGKDQLNEIVDDLMELSVQGSKEAELAQVAFERYHVDEPMLQAELVARAIDDSDSMSHRDPETKYVNTPMQNAGPHTSDPGMVQMATPKQCAVHDLGLEDGICTCDEIEKENRFNVVGVYDNGGETADRYTVVVDEVVDGNGVDRFNILLSDDALSPQGVNMIVDSSMGGTGTPIEFEDLPEQVQTAVNRRLQELKSTGALKHAGGKGWDVFLNGKKIDTVFFDDDMDAETVKRSLVDHDGYDPGITVRADLKQAADPVPPQAPAQPATPAAPAQAEPSQEQVEEMVRKRIQLEGKLQEIGSQIEKMRTAMMQTVLPLQKEVGADEPALISALKKLDDMSIMVDGWKAKVSEAFERVTPKYKDILTKVQEVAEEEVIPRISKLITQLLGTQKYLSTTTTPERLLMRQTKPTEKESDLKFDGWNFGKEAAPITQKLKEWWAMLMGWFKRDVSPELDKVEESIEEIDGYLDAMEGAPATAPVQVEENE